MSFAHLTPLRMVELALAIALLVAGIVFYRRRDPANGSYGGQGAVIMLVIAAILGIHALGGLDYHPSAGELETLKARAQ